MAPLSILYVDDETVSLNLFKRMFQNEYDVRVSDNPKDAIRLIRECPADIIISGQSQPQMSGNEFLREACKICSDSFRIMLTSNAAVGDYLKEIASGTINIFIPKPWNENQMRGFLTLAANTLARRSSLQRV